MKGDGAQLAGWPAGLVGAPPSHAWKTGPSEELSLNLAANRSEMS